MAACCPSTWTNSAKATKCQVIRNNGFMGLKALLPPASRRGLVLIDPSYELKTDYGQVASCIDDALRRFATGCYMIWYPVDSASGSARAAAQAQDHDATRRPLLAARHAVDRP